MSSLRFVLAALLLSAAGFAGAGVPVIELAPSLEAQGGPSGRLELIGERLPAAPVASASQFPVPVPASAAAGLVAERPQPPFAALLLLLVGCVVYLARHRGPGFALRPTRTLS